MPTVKCWSLPLGASRPDLVNRRKEAQCSVEEEDEVQDLDNGGCFAFIRVAENSKPDHTTEVWMHCGLKSAGCCRILWGEFV